MRFTAEDRHVRFKAALAPFAFAAGLMLAACSNAKEADTVGPAAAPAAVAPPGVSTDLGTTHSGIYPANGESCCWLAGDAKFMTPVSSNARTLALSLYTPNVAPIAKNGETMTVFVDGKRLRDARLEPGRSTVVSVPLAHSGGDRLARVELRMSYSYVPKEERVNEDLRRLSVMLSSVTAR